jgi:hypothetical protein
MLPILVTIVPLVAVQFLLPSGSILQLLIDIAAVFVSGGWLYWWVNRGQVLTTSLVQQMKAEESGESVILTSRFKTPLYCLFFLWMGGFLSFTWFGPKDAELQMVVDLVNVVITLMFSIWVMRSQTKALGETFRNKETSGLSDVYRNRRSVEDRLDDLERLKRRDMVTPEEYAAKRQEILKDL